jgi:hypothetical protein
MANDEPSAARELSRWPAWSPRVLLPAAPFVVLSALVTGPAGIVAWVLVLVTAWAVLRRRDMASLDERGVTIHGRDRLAFERVDAVHVVERPDVSRVAVLHLTDGTEVRVLGSRDWLRSWSLLQPRRWEGRADRFAAALGAAAGWGITDDASDGAGSHDE